MADLSDVVAAIASLVNASFYPADRPALIPNELSPVPNPAKSYPPSTIGKPVWVSRGWPLPEEIDLAVGNKGPKASKGVWISVFPQVNLTQVTSSALRRWEQIPGPPPTMTAEADDNAGTVLLTGMGSTDLEQYLTVLVGRSAYSVPIAALDTAESVAAAVAAVVAADYPSATAIGPLFLINEGGALAARIGRKGTMLAETERERQSIMTTIWAPDDDTRKAAAVVARQALCAEPRLRLPDGTTANLTYRQTNDSDGFEKVGVYRRDIHYWAEFSTYIRVDGYEVTAPTVSVSAG